MPKPYQRAIPILAYRDLAGIHGHLADTFQMRPGVIERDPARNAVHGEVYAADGSAIWLHRDDPEHGFVAPAQGSTNAGVVVIVDDVDAHHRHAVERGARIDYPPTDMDYGLREYGARDPEGGRWYFASWLRR